MRLQGFVSALILAAAIAVPTTAPAGTIKLCDTHPRIDQLLPGGSLDVLHENQRKNRNLTSGEYAFFGLNLPYGSGFLDDWSFTLADDSDISVRLFDAELPLPTGFGTLFGSNSPGYLFDTKYLTVSLFNSAGDLLGTTGENGILHISNLLAGEWYTLAVSGKVNGLLGSGYFGNLTLSTTDLPLGDSWHLFGSALLLLAIRARKWVKHQVAS